MADSVTESLILDLLEWLVKRDRNYQRPPRHSKFTLLDGSLPHGRAFAAHADTL